MDKHDKKLLSELFRVELSYITWGKQQEKQDFKKASEVVKRGRHELIDAHKEINRLQDLIGHILHESSGIAGLSQSQLRARLVRICKIAMRERESKEGLNNE